MEHDGGNSQLQVCLMDWPMCSVIDPSKGKGEGAKNNSKQEESTASLCCIKMSCKSNMHACQGTNMGLGEDFDGTQKLL
jgi:hypothetical protein